MLSPKCARLYGYMVSTPNEVPVCTGKAIVMCFDGTGDWIGTDYTNVAKLYAALEKTDRQICFYDGGVGTLADPGALTSFQRVFLQLLDLAVATGLRGKVLAGYDFLVQNYEPGDRIFLFGFSRGAYTARVLAGMIYNFGLLTKVSAHLSGYLWQMTTGIGKIGAFRRSANRIKRDFAIGNVPVEFMGLFDTVSSIGVLSRFRTFPNTDCIPNVKRICHAVSIDEQRNGFPEALISPKQEGLTEVWFPGVHRDCGGGVPTKLARIADEALCWIQSEVKGELEFSTMYKVDEQLPPIPNYAAFDPYAFLGFYPMKMFNKTVSAFRVFWPNFRHMRTVPDHALVHETAFKLKDNPDLHYDPANWPEHPTLFRTGEHTKAPERYIVPPTVLNAPDCVGILLGVTLLLLLWNRLVGSPLGPSWPDVTFLRIPVAGWVGILFLGFFGCQLVGQKYTDKVPPQFRLRSGGALQWVGLGLTVLFFLLSFIWRWSLVRWGFVAGLGYCALAQAPPRPALRADRTLPAVLGAGVFAVMILWMERRFPGTKAVESGRDWQSAVPAVSALLLAAIAFARDLYQDRIQMTPIDEKGKAEQAKWTARAQPRT